MAGTVDAGAAAPKTYRHSEQAFRIGTPIAVAGVATTAVAGEIWDRHRGGKDLVAMAERYLANPGTGSPEDLLRHVRAGRPTTNLRPPAGGMMDTLIGAYHRGAPNWDDVLSRAGSAQTMDAAIDILRTEGSAIARRGRIAG